MLHTMLFNPFEEPTPMDGYATVQINANLEAEVYYDFAGQWVIEVTEFRLTKSKHQLSKRASELLHDSDMVADFSFEEALRENGSIPDYL